MEPEAGVAVSVRTDDDFGVSTTVELGIGTEVGLASGRGGICVASAFVAAVTGVASKVSSNGEGGAVFWTPQADSSRVAHAPIVRMKIPYFTMSLIIKLFPR